MNYFVEGEVEDGAFSFARSAPALLLFLRVFSNEFLLLLSKSTCRSGAAAAAAAPLFFLLLFIAQKSTSAGCEFFFVSRNL